MKQTRWRWAWVAWLIAFLCLEIPAAVSERGDEERRAKTLSRNVWAWFNTRPERAVFLAFWVALGAHFLAGTTVVPVVVFGAGVAFVIGRDAWRG